MVSRRLLVAATIFSVLIGLLGVALYARQRVANCAYLPLIADNLLPNADLATPGLDGLPQGWAAGSRRGVQLGEFAVDGDGRAMQLLGIANFVQTPSVPVRPGQPYCFHGLAITDSLLRSPTRAQLAFVWRDAAGTVIAEDRTLWQPVVLWQPDAPPASWSSLRGAFVAPPAAAELLVRVHPASDDRIYLDASIVRTGGTPQPQPTPNDIAVSIAPWPAGKRAAVAFTFDWETAMGGLVHSRSEGDPVGEVRIQDSGFRSSGNTNDEPDYVLRGLRMREGVTTTIELFRPYGVRATYFATGYNFLDGNTAQRRFMGDPTFTWATSENRWLSDRWASTPWFADDPYGTVASDPAWYFGDLIDPLLEAGHEIQSHTFSHFYGGLVDAATWRADLEAWNEFAAAKGVASPHALAFPWSSSAGMSDASWNMLEAAGVRAVTRLSDQEQYNLFPLDANGLVADPRCRALPGHDILACPDFYLTQESAQQAIAQIERAIAVGGMIDLWAHTEELITAEQLAAWDQVVRYAAENEQVWIAPFSELATWQRALAAVRIEAHQANVSALSFTLANTGEYDLIGLTLNAPFAIGRVTVNGDDYSPSLVAGSAVRFDLGAAQQLEVMLWPVE
jgi:peptidoglycan/xylan/chitin deacetylase (PgdA/CDA1 family)